MQGTRGPEGDTINPAATLLSAAQLLSHIQYAVDGDGLPRDPHRLPQHAALLTKAVYSTIAKGVRRSCHVARFRHYSADEDG